jgi:hypothetical protein
MAAAIAKEDVLHTPIKPIFFAAAVLTAQMLAASASCWAQEQPSGPDQGAPTLQPSFAPTLQANPSPQRFDLNYVGPVYVTGAASGLAQIQTNALPADRTRQLDIDNAQVFLNKPSGQWQFFVQAGYYAIPALGAPYVHAVDTTPTLFTTFPVAYLKYAATDNISIIAGKLPTLIGAESTFSYQNLNIQRGLLWNQENAINRGVQATYTSGPLTIAASVNDGFYSDRYSWVSLSASYALDKANTLAVIAGDNTSHTSVSSARTPLFQNNEQIVNLIYTRTQGPWSIQPYLQYTHVPRIPQLGAGDSANTYGGAILLSYDFGSAPAAYRTPGLKLPVRLEYIASSGTAAHGAPNLLYGPGSAAWSLTITPTYQYKKFFARAEISYVGTRKTTPGLAFGGDGNNRTQVRGLLEAGFLL